MYRQLYLPIVILGFSIIMGTYFHLKKKICHFPTSPLNFTKELSPQINRNLKNEIELTSLKSVAKKRQQTLNYIFGSEKESFSEIVDESKIKNFQFSYRGEKSIAKGTIWKLNLGESIEAHVVELRPENLSGLILLVGLGSKDISNRLIDEFEESLLEGISVVIFYPPNIQPNYFNMSPEKFYDRSALELDELDRKIRIKNLGIIKFGKKPEWYQYIAPKKGNPEKYFVASTAFFLKVLLDKNEYKKIAAVGFGDGAWVSILIAALFEEINDTFVFLKRLPISIHSLTKSSPHYLFEFPFGNIDLLRIINTWERYILATVGDNRNLSLFIKEGQFSGELNKTIREIPTIVRDEMQKLGNGTLQVEYIEDEQYEKMFKKIRNIKLNVEPI